MNSEPFFDYARERYNILLRRNAGLPKPWTDDLVLRQFRFCNVFREDDTTTIWFHRHMRRPLLRDPRVLEATVIFRWFNRTQTGDRLLQEDLHVAWDTARAVRALRDLKPLVTGSYIIKTPNGMDKLTGLCWCIDQFLSRNPRQFAGQLLQAEHSQHYVWEWLRCSPYLGPFMAYEVVTDLTNTFLLNGAPDLLSWANAGPGAVRGLRRLWGEPFGRVLPPAVAEQRMRQLLAASRDPRLWPDEWPSWTMREVEHTLCEFDKYERARLGTGQPRQRYNGS